MPKKLACLFVVTVLMIAGVPARSEVKIALVPGGDPKPNELLALTEAKLFENKEIELLDRTEIDKVLAEQKLSGMFNAENAVALGQILKTDLFAVLEKTSVVIFDAKTGLRFVDETLPEKIEDAMKTAVDAVKTAIEKQQKLADSTLVTFGVLEVRNADFPHGRDAWCRAVAGMLERSLLHRGGAVLERSRLQHVNKERQLTGDATNKLLVSMKLIDLEFTRGENAESFKLTVRIGNERFVSESSFDKPLDAVHEIAGMLLKSKIEESMKVITTRESARIRKMESERFLKEATFLSVQRRNTASMERAEVAFAIDPTSTKRALLDILYRVATRMANPPLKPGEPYSPPTAEQIQDMVRYVTRIIDLSETNPYRPFQGIRTRFVIFDRQRPECREILRAFNSRAVNNWYRTQYDTDAIKTDDPVKNFTTAVSKASPRVGVFVPDVYYGGPRHSTFAEYNAEIYEMVIASLIQLYDKIPEEDCDKIPANALTGLLTQFADDATRPQRTPAGEFDANARQTYLRTIELMEKSSNADIQKYAQLAKKPLPRPRTSSAASALAAETPPEVKPPLPKLWSEEIPLVSFEKVKRPVIFWHHVRGNMLYYFTSHTTDTARPTDTIRLDSIDLETLKITEGVSYSHPGGVRDFARNARAFTNQYAIVRESYSAMYNQGIFGVRGNFDDYSVHGDIDDQNTYLVSGGKIHIYPLNGGDSWTFCMEDGLPGRAVEVCSFKGKLYAVLDNTAWGEKVGWFVAIDLPTKTFEVLSSTSAREGKAPFVNTSSVPIFSGFFADYARDRLLFFVNSPLRQFGGLWSMDGKTSTFTHLLSQPRYNTTVFHTQVPDESHFFVSGSRYAEIFDLDDLTEERELEIPLAVSSENIPNPLIKATALLPEKAHITFYRNTLWSSYGGVSWDKLRTIGAHFVQCHLEEDSEPQRLALPENIKWITMIVPLPNDKGLLVGDGHSIVHLRFDTLQAAPSEQ